MGGVGGRTSQEGGVLPLLTFLEDSKYLLCYPQVIRNKLLKPAFIQSRRIRLHFSVGGMSVCFKTAAV